VGKLYLKLYLVALINAQASRWQHCHPLNHLMRPTLNHVVIEELKVLRAWDKTRVSVTSPECPKWDYLRKETGLVVLLPIREHLEVLQMKLIILMIIQRLDH
jgi:hypothetical protein